MSSRGGKKNKRRCANGRTSPGPRRTAVLHVRVAVVETLVETSPNYSRTTSLPLYARIKTLTCKNKRLTAAAWATLWRPSHPPTLHKTLSSFPGSSATRDDRAVTRTPVGYTQMMARRLLITTTRRATLMKPVSRSLMLTTSSLSQCVTATPECGWWSGELIVRG